MFSESDFSSIFLLLFFIQIYLSLCIKKLISFFSFFFVHKSLTSLLLKKKRKVDTERKRAKIKSNKLICCWGVLKRNLKVNFRNLYYFSSFFSSRLFNLIRFLIWFVFYFVSLSTLHLITVLWLFPKTRKLWLLY